MPLLNLCADHSHSFSGDTRFSCLALVDWQRRSDLEATSTLPKATMPLLPCSFLTGTPRKGYLCVTNLPLRRHATPLTNESIASDVFDRLQKATAADPAELAGLCRDYLAEARGTLAQLRCALAQKDAGQIRDRAHYLRGSSLVIGATVVARCCASLEQMGRNSELQDAALVLDQTSAALDVVQTELANRLGPSVVPVEGSAA